MVKSNQNHLAYDLSFYSLSFRSKRDLLLTLKSTPIPTLYNQYLRTKLFFLMFLQTRRYSGRSNSLKSAKSDTFLTLYQVFSLTFIDLMHTTVRSPSEFY